jgi:predicted DNA-binding protein (MmcQ/YjbR family)
MASKRAQDVLKELRKICLALPETSEAKQFGSPVWRAGKKVFARAYSYRTNAPTHKLQLAFWVGIDQQALLIRDKQFEIPAYMGHNGWIALDVTKEANWHEIRSLVLFSYRHFALSRMLNVLETEDTESTTKRIANGTPRTKTLKRKKA